jgi:hypothetical protein
LYCGHFTALMKSLIVLTGIATMAAGLLFVGQGIGYIRWPASSFMINDTSWVYYGCAIAAVGLIPVATTRR